MLEFIVLGIVPGTEFQISLQHIATAGWVALLAYGSIRVKQLRQQQAQNDSNS